MPLSQYSETHALQSTQVFNVSDGTNQLGIGSSQQTDSRWDQIYATNAGLIDHVVNMAMVYGPPDQHMYSVNVPAGAGLGGVPGVYLLLNVGTTLQPGLVIAVGQQLVVNLEVGVVADGDVHLTAFGGLL